MNATSTTETSTLSPHDALPICGRSRVGLAASLYESLIGAVYVDAGFERAKTMVLDTMGAALDAIRSEEHTSELQSRRDLVCRLLLEKKKQPSLSCVYQFHA